MLFKSDDLKKSDSKCDLMEEKREKRDSIEVDNLDLVAPKRERRKRHVFSIVLLVTVLALASWTMMYKQYRFAALSPIKIEDEAYKRTMRVVSEAERVLQEVRNQAEVMCRKNREAALKYVTGIRDAMKERTRIGVEKVNQLVEENLSNIRDELLALRTTTQDIFNGLVDVLRKDVDKIVDSLRSADDQNLEYLLNDAISHADYEVRAMWNDLDQMYTYYTSYSSDLVEGMAQNMTDRISGLVNSQSRRCDCTLYDRVSMCYNISSANIETSKTIETVVHVINNLYNVTDSVSDLLSMGSREDEHSVATIDESTSLLEKYKKTSQETLETLLTDHFCFLGSAVRVTAENVYPRTKRFILRSWKAAIQKASAKMTATLTVDPLIKDEYRRRIVDDAKESLRQLGTLVKTKAALLEDGEARNRLVQKADFDDLVLLMENRFQNISETINAIHATNLWVTGETVKFNVDLIVDRRIPFLSSISLQNYLPTDVCPLAMDFASFVLRFLNDRLYRGIANDELDRLLPDEQGYWYASNGPQSDEDVSAPVTDVEVKIFVFNESSTENETTAGGDRPGQAISPQLLTADAVDVDNHPTAEAAVPSAANESPSTATDERTTADAKADEYENTSDDAANESPAARYSAETGSLLETQPVDEMSAEVASDANTKPSDESRNDSSPPKSVGSSAEYTSNPASSFEEVGVAVTVEPAATTNVESGEERQKTDVPRKSAEKTDARPGQPEVSSIRIAGIDDDASDRPAWTNDATELQKKTPDAADVGSVANSQAADAAASEASAEYVVKNEPKSGEEGQNSDLPQKSDSNSAQQETSKNISAFEDASKTSERAGSAGNRLAAAVGA